MDAKDKVLKILLNALPVVLMIGLIPVIGNDYILTAAYGTIIAAAFATRYERRTGSSSSSEQAS